MKIATNSKVLKSTTPTGKLPYRRTTEHLLKLRAAILLKSGKLKVKELWGDGIPTSIAAWTVHEDWHIVDTYNTMSRGLLNYYVMIDYSNPMRRIYYILKILCAKLLSHRHKFGSVATVFRKYGKNLTMRNYLI